MKFSIGDKVIMKRTGEEGTVTDYISKDMLEVEVNDTQFPVYTDEIDHPYLKWFTDKAKKTKKSSLPEQLPVEKEKHRPQRLSRGIYLSFMPIFATGNMEDMVTELKVHLINETPNAIRYAYQVKMLQQTAFKLEGSLHPFGNLYLHTIAYADMNDHPRFFWQLIDAENDANKTEEGQLRLKPSKLFQHVNDVLVKNEPTFSYLLIEDFVLKPKPEKKESFTPLPKPNLVRRHRFNSLADLPRHEVDLHIEVLAPNYKSMSNAEIMELQLQTLQKSLHLAIVHRQERLIVIHGVGTGALRDAVHRVLKETPEVQSFRNEYMGRYGFGATAVIFKR